MLNLFSRQREVADQPQAKARNQKRRIALPSKIGSAGAVYNATGNTETRTSFRESEYNLGEIAKVMDIEAFVRQAFNKHVELCLKEGYKISSRNEDATLYIKRRFREMAEVSGVTLNMLLRGITQNIVAYSNAFVVKVRNSSISSGNPIPRSTRSPSAPIAAYFNLDPTTIRIKRDVHGKVYRYEQKVPGNPIIPEFHADNVVHFYYDRKEGLAFGTPYVIPVLDDIRTLRRMEENIEMLLVQHLFPLYQYIVGTEENPAEVYEDGTTEVDVIKSQIENMPTEGSIVTPERHEIRALGAEGKALDAAGYLRYFEQRVLAGLGMSEIALGRGGTANRSTASTIDKMMTDRCKDFQDVIEEFVNEYIIKELLYEGGFEIDENEDNFVKLKFNEIDIDSMLKTENHIVFKYEHDAITESEMRAALGQDPITEEQRQDMYFERVTKPKSIILAVDEPYTVEAKGNAVNKISKEEKKKKETINREKPANQHGSKPARTSQKKDQLLHESIEDIAKTLGIKQEASSEEKGPPVTEKRDIAVDRIEGRLRDRLLSGWDSTMRDMIDLIGDKRDAAEEVTSERVDFIVNLTKDSISKYLYVNMTEALSHGEARAVSRLNGSFKKQVDQSMKREVIKQEVQKCVDDLFGDLSHIIVRHISRTHDSKMLVPTIVGVFGALKYKIDSLAKRQINKAYNFGYNLVMEDNADVVPDNVRSE